jgi:CrcB protein
MSFLELIVLSISSTIGTFFRYQLTLYFYDEKSTYQLGILIANLLGAYLIGLYIGYIQNVSTIASIYKLLITTGFLGSLTTFSTFSMEIVLLLQKGLLLQAILWLIAHVVGALCCTYLGILTQQSI